MVSTNFTKGNGTRAVTMELLDYSFKKSRFGSSIGGQLLASVLASSVVCWVCVAAILKKPSVLRNKWNV